jgi:plastocyanin
MKRSPLLATAAVLVVALVALAVPGTAVASSGPTVKVTDNKFSPKTLEIGVGDTVTWQFKGGVKHNVSGKGFPGKATKRGSYARTFNSAGTYAFTCTLHAGMKGKIVVE